ncbi:MAG: glycosyltransferase family 4 protein [Candidatus Rokuibacteriota bacterium]
MRILFATLTMPFPPTNGHRLRLWALLRALTEEGHKVSVVSFADSDEIRREDPELDALCQRVDRISLPNGSGFTRPELLRRAFRLLSPYPFGVDRLRSAEFTAIVSQRLTEESFDLLICDGIYNIQNLPRESGVPVVLNKDDVAHVLIERYLQFEPNPARRLYGRLEARKVSRWERRACSDVTATLVSSEVDRALLHGLCPGVPMFVVPNVVDPEHYTVPAEDGDPLTVLFQGGMDWHPNRDAVGFFALDILPKLRQLVPGVTFRIAGRSPDDAFRRRFAGVPGLEFTGTVPDMRAEIARSTVCVVPLRIGSGTRLKIIEAAAMGKAIISTRVGAEGLDFVNGEDIILVDEPRSFAGAVKDLLADPERRRRLGQAARRRVEHDYSTASLRPALRTALALTLPGPTPSPPR